VRCTSVYGVLRGFEWCDAHAERNGRRWWRNWWTIAEPFPTTAALSPLTVSPLPLSCGRFNADILF